MKFTTKWNPNLGLSIDRNGYGFYYTACKTEAEGLAWLATHEAEATARIDEIEYRMSGMEGYSKRFGTAGE